MAKRVKKPRTKPMLKPKRRKKVKAKAPIKPGSKAKKDFAIVKPRKVVEKKYLLENYFTKKGKKPPIRYRRSVPKGMVKIHLRIKNKKIKAGQLLEFKYGYKQKPGQVGGWKNDPRPVILIFHDDRKKYVEGINTNYLSNWYLKKIRQIMARFPGVDGEALYDIFTRTAKHAIKKGYRKYMRLSLRDIYLYVYKDEILQTINELQKQSLSDMGVSDRGKTKQTSGLKIKWSNENE